MEHTDDSGAFYERMLGADCWGVARLARWRSLASGQVVNGLGATEASADARPTALYLSSNLPTAGAMSPDVNVDRGGWLRVHYGASGNVVAMTARARCHDLSGATACYDDATETDVDDRASHLLAVCICEDEQHYQYRWDELNRLHEARRYDRTGGTGTWSLEVRQRYRYDSANVRTVKETVDDFVIVSGEAVSGDERVALYVAGDYERRGLVQDAMTDTYEPSDGVTEAQYLVSGARVVWKSASSAPFSTGSFDSDLRVTMALPNLIQSTSAVVDLASGDLLESVTFHPNGVRETLVSNREVEGFALEPVGFTGKEDEAEVGLVYFGERYLMPHLGRWASADPLQTHGGGGGELGNSYHYVSGNVLQARDPLGLDERVFNVAIVTDSSLDTPDGSAFATEGDLFEAHARQVTQGSPTIVIRAATPGEAALHLQAALGKERARARDAGDTVSIGDVFFVGHSGVEQPSIAPDFDSPMDDESFDLPESPSEDGDASFMTSISESGEIRRLRAPELETYEDGRRRPVRDEDGSYALFSVIATSLSNSRENSMYFLSCGIARDRDFGQSIAAYTRAVRANSRQPEVELSVFGYENNYVFREMRGRVRGAEEGMPAPDGQTQLRTPDPTRPRPLNRIPSPIDITSPP